MREEKQVGIEQTATARKQLRNLDRPVARRIVDFMDERIAGQADPRNTDQALTGPLLGAYWRYRVGDFRIICDIQDGALCVLAIEIGHRIRVSRTTRPIASGFLTYCGAARLHLLALDNASP